MNHVLIHITTEEVFNKVIAFIKEHINPPKKRSIISSLKKHFFDEAGNFRNPTMRFNSINLSMNNICIAVMKLYINLPPNTRIINVDELPAHKDWLADDTYHLTAQKLHDMLLSIKQGNQLTELKLANMIEHYNHRSEVDSKLQLLYIIIANSKKEVMTYFSVIAQLICNKWLVLPQPASNSNTKTSIHYSQDDLQHMT